jgi:Tfp pilus assembly protein PilF
MRVDARRRVFSVRRMRTPHLLSALAVTFVLSSASAQMQPLKVPEPSPAASVEQTVGLTDMKVSYHRPGVSGRQIWGALVPYGQVWRAGANENTTVTFSSPVKIAKKVLPAGTYGLHMIPTAKDWTVIFSSMSVLWGSYGYEPKEDALRLTVSPQPAEAFEERLSYRFDNPTETGVALTLRWEKLKIAVPIEVDTPAVVMASMRSQLRGGAQFNQSAWAQAAEYWVDHGGNLDEAQKMVDKSLASRETFHNLSVRAAIAQKKGDAKKATELRTKAMTVATEPELNLYGYKLLGEKKLEEAISIFEKNAQAHPSSWNVYDSLAEAYVAKGDRKTAVEHYGKALALVKDTENKKRIEQAISGLQKQP